MLERSSTRRPWLAALLAVLATGAGHLYLRRWLRAVGWLALTAAVTVLFVPETALTAAIAGEAVELEPLLPMFIVVGLSVLDAYLVAKLQNRLHTSFAAGDAGASAAAAIDGASGTDSVRAAGGDDERADCPHCGKPLDPDIDFCHWCTTPLDDPDDDRVGREVTDG